MEIIVAPNVILSQKAKSIEKVDSFVLKTIKEMKKALDEAHDPIGVGFAAPQIGKSLRIFIAKPTPKSKHLIFINPRIVTRSTSSGQERAKLKVKSKPKTKDKRHETKLEGCLSLPDIWGFLKRPPKITVSFMDEKCTRHTKTFKGMLGIIVQHEIDHLNGILFTKRVLQQRGKLYKSSKDEKGEEVFEELEI